MSEANTGEALTASQASEADTICRLHLEPAGAFTALFSSPFEPPPPPPKPFVLIFNIPIAVWGLFGQCCDTEDTTFRSLLRNHPQSFIPFALLLLLGSQTIIW